MPLWQARVPAENLFVGKFRDVSQDPVQLLQSVYRFLGVSDDRNYVGASAQRRINPTQDAGIPANLECVGATSCGPAHPNPTTTPIRRICRGTRAHGCFWLLQGVAGRPRRL